MSADLFLEVRNFHCNPYGVPVAPGLTSPNYDGLLPAPDGAAWAPQSLARDDSLPFLWWMEKNNMSNDIDIQYTVYLVKTPTFVDVLTKY